MAYQIRRSFKSMEEKLKKAQNNYITDMYQDFNLFNFDDYNLQWKNQKCTFYAISYESALYQHLTENLTGLTSYCMVSKVITGMLSPQTLKNLHWNSLRLQDVCTLLRVRTTQSQSWALLLCSATVLHILVRASEFAVLYAESLHLLSFHWHLLSLKMTVLGAGLGLKIC